MSGLSVTRAALRRVGHKGADHIAPGNTAASFDAALAAGVDMIEFDVIPERHGDPSSDLYLAHDYRDLGRRERVRLEEGLAHLRAEAFTGVELDVDLKGPGYEERVVRALRAHGLLERALITSQYRASLDAVRALEPTARVGWSIPRLRRDPFTLPRAAQPGLWVALQALRAVLPLVVAPALRSGRFDAVMIQWRLVTAPLVAVVKRCGGEIYVWTVDERDQIERLERLGVTGVITNDPRLFDPG
jgi:glycerophosphoryl diester phosphodiesterase